MLGANIRVTALPADYRWMSWVETEVWDTVPDAIQVIDMEMTKGSPWGPDNDSVTDLACPKAYPVMLDFDEFDNLVDCIGEFGPHTDHKDCADRYVSL